MITKDRIAALAIIAAVLLGWLQTANIPAEPRFFPRAVLGFMGALAALMLVRTFIPARKPAGELSFDPPLVTNGRAFLITAVMTLGLIWLITQIGFFTASTLFMLLFAFGAGYRRFVMTGVTTAVFVACLYVVFVLLLQRPLPRELLLHLIS